MGRNLHRDAIFKELKHWPEVEHRVEPRGKHKAVIFKFGEEERFTIIPSTGSDSTRGPKNTVTNVRQTLHRLGAIRRDHPVASKRQVRHEREVRASNAVAKLAINNSMVILTIPNKSPLRERLYDPDAYWTFEMRSNPDPKGKPFFAAVRKPKPPKKKHPGLSRFGVVKVNDSLACAISKTTVPVVAKHGPFSSTAVELREDNGDTLIFNMPTTVEPVHEVHKHVEAREPEPIEETPVITPEPEPPVEAPKAETPRRNEPVIIQPAPVPLNIERAVKYLNKRKKELGNDLRIYIEDGFIRVNHTIR